MLSDVISVWWMNWDLFETESYQMKISMFLNTQVKPREILWVLVSSKITVDSLVKKKNVS